MKFDFKGYVSNVIRNDSTADFANKVFSDFCKPKDIDIIYYEGKPTVELNNNGDKVSVFEYSIEYDKDNFFFGYHSGYIEARLYTPKGAYIVNNYKKNNNASIMYSYFDVEALENLKELYYKKFNKVADNTYINLKDFFFIPDEHFDVSMPTEDDLINTIREIIKNPEIIKTKMDEHIMKYRKTIN